MSSLLVSKNNRFNLSLNNKEQDRWLLEHEHLVKRIEEIKKEKMNKINNQINNLYNKIKELQINKTKSSENKINILKEQIKKLHKINVLPTIADINLTHDFFLKSSFKPFVNTTFDYSRTNSNTKAKLGNSCQFQLPRYGNFLSDTLVYIKFKSFQASDDFKVKYCEFLGHRLLKHVSFHTGSNLIDEFNSEDYNFYYEHSLPKDKQIAWKNIIGQEIPHDVYLTQDPINQEFKEKKQILNGPQTYKKTQPEIELFIPLLFWFCDSTQALCSDYLPLDSKIDITFGTKEEVTMSSGGVYNEPEIEECALYVKHIYVDDSILELLNNTLGLTLIRTHQSHSITLNDPFRDVILDNLKFPTECIYMAFRPIENLLNPEIWYRNNKLTSDVIKYPIIYFNSETNDHEIGEIDVNHWKSKDIITSICLACDDQTFFDDMPAKFYHSYIPYKYTKSNKLVSNDTGSFIYNFFLSETNNFQPNGYINLSNAYLFQMSYDSNIIDSQNICRLYISTKTINFLKTDNGVCELYYKFN